MYGFLGAGVKKKRGRCSREVAVSGGSTIVKNGELNVYKKSSPTYGMCDQFWFSNAAHVACLFQNKVMFLL